MTKQPIETIVFDLGGVLIDWNPEYLYQHLIPSEKERKHFLSEICSPAWNEEQDGGRALSDATEMLVKEHPDYENEIRAYYGRWAEMLKEPIQGTVDLLSELKEQHKVSLYALTNWSAETFPIAQNRFDLLSWFEGIIVSGVEKTRKPFQEIFQLLLSRYNLQAQTSLFIDDNLRNVKAAEAFGFQAFHFTGPDALRKRLEADGVLTQNSTV